MRDWPPNMGASALALHDSVSIGPSVAQLPRREDHLRQSAVTEVNTQRAKRMKIYRDFKHHKMDASWRMLKLGVIL
jgi:hypothetical protein